MQKESVLEAFSDISREKGIGAERLEGIISEAILAATRRKFKQYSDVEVRFNSKTGSLEVFHYKIVRENLTDPQNEISLEEARRIDKDVEEGDEVEYTIENTTLSRAISQTARQLIFQKIREVEREIIYDELKDRIGEILHGTVSRVERNRVYITFNRVEEVLHRSEQPQHERYNIGESVRVILLDVLSDTKEPARLHISRSHPSLVKKLFEIEVPEIFDSSVEIVSIARDAGVRTKMAVSSSYPDIDPVGACVGMRGSRVQAVISELNNEKIDIIRWSEDLATFVVNALAPAEITRIRIDEENKTIDVEVEEDQLSLCIGKNGQNVRLASRLVGYTINVNANEDKTASLEEQIRARFVEQRNQDTADASSDSTEADAQTAEALAEATKAAAETDAEAATETIATEQPISTEENPLEADADSTEALTAAPATNGSEEQATQEDKIVTPTE